MERPVAYDDYEISGCVRLNATGKPCIAGLAVEPCDDTMAHFWTLYGHITGSGVESIADFPTRQEAEAALIRLSIQL
jgi:hypothetical protein